MNKITLMSDGIDNRTPEIKLLIAGKALIVFKGLNILRTRSGLSDTELMGINSKIAVITTKKSSQFQ
jgi:hypothetical protein